MRRGDWTREELILALDLYFRLDFGQMHSKHPYVIKLSKDLRDLNAHNFQPLPHKYRSPGSVSLKLANFKRLDQHKEQGIGMKHGSHGDGETWAEFHRKKNTLKNEADLIRQLYLKLDHKDAGNALNAAQSKKRQDLIRLSSNIYICQICGFNSELRYGELGKNIMEIHGIAGEEPLVLCPNCNKVLTKNSDILDHQDLRRIIKKK